MMVPVNRPTILGIQVSPGTHDTLMQSIRQHIGAGNGLLHVVTANPEYVMTAQNDFRFRQAVNSAGVITIDGAGLAIAAKLLHPSHEWERYTGVTLTPDMAAISAESGARAFLLGAGPGVAAEAATELRRRYPNTNIVGTWSDGSPRADDDEETIRRIREAQADILLVAYGAPAQIYWIERNFAALENSGVKVVAGIGGALDYISGNTPWAPAIVRKLGLEWLYRLVREPWRWRRQLVLPKFALLVLREVAVSRSRGGVE